MDQATDMVGSSSRPGQDPRAFCRDILPHVSRTFALTIPLLDEPLRSEVGVSYLLCRIADTIEDRADLDPQLRTRLFDGYLATLRAPAEAATLEDFLAAWPVFADEHHQTLVEHTGDVLGCYAEFPPATREAVIACVEEMVSGMRRYPGPGQAVPAEACGDLPELETYCHFVAGTVGVLLTRLFAAHLPVDWLTRERVEDGRRFGLGLQLTNVLKDYPGDRRRGVSYLPTAWFTGTEPPTLDADALREVVGRALDHLDAGGRYVLSIPSGRPDMRLFCLWAGHLALATLELVARVDRGHGGLKVTREQVFGVLEEARNAVADDTRLTRLQADYRRRVDEALATRV